MAVKATVIKADLQVSDLDRSHYAHYPLTLAQHPSETDLRLMVRMVAFALFADPRLAFGKGLSSDDEPDLWRRDYTGDIEQWIDIGQPEPARVRKAAGRAREVIIVNYGGRAADLWWDKHATDLKRIAHLRVLDVPADQLDALSALMGRSMQLDAYIQDGEVQLSNDNGSVPLAIRTRLAPR